MVEVCVSRFRSGHLAAPSPLDPSLKILTKSESAQQAYLKNKFILHLIVFIRTCGHQSSFAVHY